MTAKLELHDACYIVHRLQGKVFNHPKFKNGDSVFPSQPVSFDPESNVLTTINGSVYTIISYHPDKESVVRRILEEVGTQLPPQA